MKYQNIKIFGILACLFAVGSCVKEVEQPDMYGQVGDTAFFKAVNADNDQTRTVRREDGSLWWSPSETIRLFYGNQSFKFTSTNTSAAASVTFKGSLSGLSYNNADKFWALYPYAEADSFDGSFLTMTLPSEQKAVAGSFDKNVFPCVATSRDFNLSFRNVCGGVKFCVSKAGVSKVVFKGNLSEPLAGTVKVGLKGESNIPFVSECLEPQTEITLSASNGQTLEVGTWYHLVALPTRLTKGYSMVLYFIDGHSELVSSNNTVEIKRSFFGKLTNVDEKVLGGGDQSAIYVGIIGFNEYLTRFPITLLNRTTKPSFDAFIDGLSMRNGTLLYYSVNESLNTLQGAIVPEELGNASLITFTDGLDQGTPGLVDPYPGDEAYLRNIQSRIQNDCISGQRVSAWSIGLKGRDAVIIDDGMFEYNLQSIASSPNMAFTEGDISTVNSRFQEIATHFRETIFRQTVTVELPTLDNCRVRFILDGATSMSDSKKYIEGDFIQSTRSLTNVKYYGLTSSSGSNVAGVKKGIFTVFTFQELANKDGVLILQEDINEWYNRWGSWAKNSEFVPEEQCSVSMHKKAALVLLNLDCSTSLDANLRVNPPLPAVFPDLQKSAKSFIEALCKYTITASSVSVNKKSMIMTPGNRSTISAEVLPEDAVNRDVRWSSSDLSVAKVSVYGEVTALKEGTAIITATTLDGVW